MRRFFLILMMLSLFSFAQAEELPMTRLDAVIQTDVAILTRDAEHYDLLRTQCGDWTSVRVTVYGMVAPRLEGMQVYGMVYETETCRRITWEDLFSDPERAAEIIAETVYASSDGNAYSQYDQVEPVPRDNFSFENGVLTVWYPADQLSHFSGRCGGVSLYPKQLEEVYLETVPVLREGSLEEILSSGRLPAPLHQIQIGDDMAFADQLYTVKDVPDEAYDYALYRFEAPETARAAILADREETDVETAKIKGIMSEHFDLFGLTTGYASREECVLLLGEPDRVQAVETSDGYSRLNVGESLYWQGETCELELHFADGILRSVALLEK